MTARNNTLDILIPLTAAVYVLMIIFNGLGGAGYTGTFILKNHQQSILIIYFKFHKCVMDCYYSLICCNQFGARSFN